jgi:iron complex outermembrane receptor protein
MTIRFDKFALLAGTALVGSLLAAGGAFAQSTGTATAENVVEEVVVTGGTRTVGGEIIKETIPKSRSTITQEFIEAQSAGQSVLQDINLLPGVNFTNNDPYGSSGGNLRIRSFDGPRISLTWDGMPLNDSGNYSIFSNQMMDGELISRAQVNLGTTDVDSPTASATGGTVSYVSRKPTDELGGFLNGAYGSFKYVRVLGEIDTGDILKTGVTSWWSGSYQNYNKFKGPGTLEKKQINARLYRDFGDNGDFVSVAFHWNVNRNNFYRNPTLAQFQTLGNAFEELNTCTRDAPTAGVADNEGASPQPGGSENPQNPSACTNYYNLRINPSNTGNIRGQGRYHLRDNLIVTVDPSFQYVLADGGGTTTLAESGNSTLTLQLLGNTWASGRRNFDLNGDGDTLDTIRYYTPNVTNTHRYGVTTSVIWDYTANQRFRVAYTLDRADHRQTGEWIAIDSAGDPLDVFGAHRDATQRVVGPDGSFMRQRDRNSIAMLNQVAADYNASFMDGRLLINAGVRAPYFTRHLQNNCYTTTTGFGYCSTAAVGTVNSDGSVYLVGQRPGESGFTTTSAPRYTAPFITTRKYDKILPNVGASYKIADGQSIYVSYAEGLSAPRTDNLYSFAVPNVQPETTQAFDLGYRYQKGRVLASAAVWDVIYKNRIVTSFDQDLGINIDRNVGEVDIWGVDTEIGFRPTDQLSLYGSASYNNSEVKSNIQFNSTTLLPTQGKELVETPHWTVGGRAQYRDEWVTLGTQFKWVSERFSTDVNDEKTDAYVVFDADVRVNLTPIGMKRSYVQFNVTNLFDKVYLGGISSRNNAITIPASGGTTTAISGASPSYTVGAPRTLQISLHTSF